MGRLLASYQQNGTIDFMLGSDMRLEVMPSGKGVYAERAAKCWTRRRSGIAKTLGALIESIKIIFNDPTVCRQIAPP